MNDETIKLLQEEVARLATLLNDPHPGISSWNSAVNASIQHLSDLKLGIKKPGSKKGL